MDHPATNLPSLNSLINHNHRKHRVNNLTPSNHHHQMMMVNSNYNSRNRQQHRTTMLSSTNRQNYFRSSLPKLPSKILSTTISTLKQSTTNISFIILILFYSLIILNQFNVAISTVVTSSHPHHYHHYQYHQSSSSSSPLPLPSTLDDVVVVNNYHVDQGMAEEVVAVPHDAYIGYEVLRLKFTSKPLYDVSLTLSDIDDDNNNIKNQETILTTNSIVVEPHIEPRFRLLAESDTDLNLVSIFASDSEDLERHVYEMVSSSGLTNDKDDSSSSTKSSKTHFTLLSDGLLMTTRDLKDLVNKPVFLAVREDATPFYVRDRVFRINVYNNTRVNKIRFNQPSALGHLLENQPSLTLVEGFERLRLIDDENLVNDGTILFQLIENDYDLNNNNNIDDLDDNHIVKRHHNQRNNQQPFRLINQTSILIVSTRSLDRESKPYYDYILSARSTDNNNNFFAQVPLRIMIDDENDNQPIFERSLYEFYIPQDQPLYSIIGNVTAKDLDETDSVVYHLTERHPNFVIIPKTGQIMLIKHSERIPQRYEFECYATDDRRPATERRSSQPIPIIVEIYREDTYNNDNDDVNDSKISQSEEIPDDNDNDSGTESDDKDNNDSIARARAKREIRHTKTYEFKESDGSTPGMVVFQLDRRQPNEKFRLETPNKWVTVDPNGAVKVKEPWDYEQLGKDKTIDFWVISSLEDGKFCFVFLVFECKKNNDILQINKLHSFTFLVWLCSNTRPHRQFLVVQKIYEYYCAV